LTAENRNESLEMGMADSLIAKLSNFREINVRPINAVRKYADPEQDAVAAGREQQVDAVLDGQIQQSGEKIRMTVRLVRVADGKPVWTKQFDEQWTDIFAVQDSISERVAGILALKLSGEEKQQLTKRFTENPEAYQLYLLGRYHFNKRTKEPVGKSIEYFKQAIAKDPNYAAAFAALADAYSTSGWFDFLPPDEAYGKAREALAQAMERDAELAAAHAVLGDIKRGYDWDLAGAESAYRRALELDPKNPMTYHSYGISLGLMGRQAESIAALEQARELDPLSVTINKTYGDLLLFARRYDEAIAQYRKVLEFEEENPYVHISLGLCYLQKNLTAEALAEFTAAARLGGLRANRDQGLLAGIDQAEQGERGLRFVI
jgi:TolB-like protein/predicted Zn-dependent protease